MFETKFEVVQMIGGEKDGRYQAKATFNTGDGVQYIFSDDYKTKEKAERKGMRRYREWLEDYVRANHIKEKK